LQQIAPSWLAGAESCFTVKESEPESKSGHGNAAGYEPKQKASGCDARGRSNVYT